MINKSIAYRLSIFISLAVISVFIVFIVATFLFNQKLLRENIENRAIGLSSKINGIVNQNIAVTREVALNISEQAIYYGENNDIELLLSMVMKKYPFINAIHVSIDSTVNLEYTNFLSARKNEEQQVFKKSQQRIYNCSNEKTIFNAIENVNQPGWTEPYRCQENEKVIVAFHCPLKYFDAINGKRSAGKVICELSLSELNESINSMSPGERGYAFLVNKKGKYITHPDEDRILRQNVFNLSEKIVDPDKINIASIFSNNETGSAIVYPDILNHEKSWVYYTPTNQNRWYLIFIMPYNELFSELYIETLKLLLFAVIGIIIIYFIITYISNRLIEPLSVVTRQLKQLSNPENKKAQGTMNEVKQVSDSLKYLKLWFEKYRTSQNQEQIRSYRRKQDLLQASEIQQSLIKTNFPAFPERDDISLYAIYKPARVVSGDLFDYFFIDDENIVFTIGDVSGKGVPAAIFMSIAQTIIKNNSSYKRAKNIVNKANIDLYTNNQHQFFVTLFLGIFNVKKGELNYCNAAHTTAFVVKTTGEIIELEQTHGLPLGLYSKKEYKDSRMKLEKGDKLVLYTDGVTELNDADKNQYGVERLRQNLGALNASSPEEMVKRIAKSLEIFQGNAPQSDDICLFVIEYKAKKSPA